MVASSKYSRVSNESNDCLTLQSSANIFLAQKGHHDSVTCVKFLYSSRLLISGSSDGKIKIWKFDGQTLKLAKTLDDHKKSVTTIAATPTANVFVSGGSDGQLNFWTVDMKENDEVDVCLRSTVSLGMMKLPLTAAIHELPKSDSGEYIVAVGTTTRVINVYTGTSSTGFKLSTSLEGHGDWVRALAFKNLGDGNLMLASGCQDRYIRIWTVQQESTSTVAGPVDELDDEETDQLSNIVYQLDTDTPYCIKFDALIIGHDDWVYCLRWHPSEVKLMSSSADSSVMVWVPDDISGVWVCNTRLGDISSKGASTATGSYGGVWYSNWIGNKSGTIVSLTNMGSWKRWTSEERTIQGQEEWIPKTGLTGHIKSVTDISWSPQSNYLLTTCLDKTTRLFASHKKAWFELSRPQIHGYEMICIFPLSNSLFVSGGDEKILRVFKATKIIANLLNSLLGHSIDADTLESDVATVPVLSLSNKAFTNAPQQSGTEDDEAGEDYTQPELDLTTPPLEDQLQRHTLWPEVEKIYGHGYEMITLAATRDGELLVSSCKANSKDHAVIRMTDISNWQECSSPLSFHTLTITRLRFSHDDKLLLSVSRDRTWSVWQRVGPTELAQVAFGKGHTRIIWDGCWLQPTDATSNSYYFATASRDKTIKIWHALKDSDLNEWQCVLSIPASVPVTAIDVVLSHFEKSVYTLAAGLDTGDIIIYNIQISSEVVLLSEIPVDHNITPAGRVNRVTWAEGTHKLAVASEDHSVRVYSQINAN